MLTKSLANDYGRFGVRANAVCPGFIVTDMADGAMEAVAAAWGISVPAAYDLTNRDVPLRRAGEPREVADVIAFLASEGASYITGAAVPVDGGATIVDLTATETLFAGAGS
jgi:NAD(P)-dependent dehydrogenase (short-subunit alcohol dehydrogenase family)